MNKVILMGRLTRDPEVRYTQSGEPIAVGRYTLAVDRKTKKEEGRIADFISCVSFGKTAEFAEQYFKKGIKVLVTGRIQTGSYTDKDGKKVYTTDVVVEEQEFAESKGSGASNREERDKAALEAAGYLDAGDGFMNIPDGIDEELPFS